MTAMQGVARSLLRATKPLRKAFKPVMHAARAARHIARYQAPDELAACPVCGASSPRPLLPIPLEGRSRTYGFASGCLRCGVLFANPLPSARQVADVYSPEGEWGRHRQDEQEKQVSRARIERLFEPVVGALDVLSPPSGAKVLDFGCGLGGMLDAFAALGWHTYGVESAMRVAFERHRELTTVPATGDFDLGVLHHVLEHVTDPLAILKQMAGAIRPDGVLLVSVPNLDDVATHGEMKYCIRAGVHVLAYTSTCLRWLLAEAGFDVVSDRSRLGTERQRHRILLAQRRSVSVRPARPLDAAIAALARYRDVQTRHSPTDWLPIRWQAAVLDLRRTKWRV